MPIQLPTMTVSATNTTGLDGLLHVQTKKAGKIKGESTIDGYVDDILVTGWQWGLKSHGALKGVATGERRSYSALTIYKGLDRATTGLMSALVAHDEVKEARLVLRRAGGEQEVYFTVLLKNARIESVKHDAGPQQGVPMETVEFVFTKVEVEYRPQLGTGLRGGSTTFTDEIYEA